MVEQQVHVGELKKQSLCSLSVGHQEDGGIWISKGILGAKVNHDPAAGQVSFFLFSFKMILFKVCTEQHPDSRDLAAKDTQ